MFMCKLRNYVGKLIKKFFYTMTNILSITIKNQIRCATLNYT